MANLEEELEGRVVHIRSVSAKMCFYDVLIDDNASLRRTALMKSWVCGTDTLELARKGREEARIHVGDKVRFEGRKEEGGVFEVVNFAVVASFRKHNPGKTFTSIPPSPAPDQEEKKSEKQCKFWISTGRCPRSGQCPYLHQDGPAKAAKMEFVREKFNRREALQMAKEDHDLKSRHRRASVFASWLKEEFPDRLDDESTAVVDVAGGKGELAIELKVRLRSRSKVVVVDPRATAEVVRMSKWQRKMVRKMREEEEGAEAAALMPGRIGKMFGADVMRELGKVSLVVGLHPDEATEALVDVAVSASVPFAVVPCCVFARSFPGRRMRGDSDQEEEPRTYEEFCRYLGQKAEGVREARLGFRGRDKVLYWTPKGL